jgi:hypothetical protein
LGGLKGLERIEGFMRAAKNGRRMDTAEAEFDKFWEFYPRKKAKGDAFKAWNQVREKRPPLAAILKALVVLRSTDDWRRENGQFVPYPATWLRSWGWADVEEHDKADVRGNGMWWETSSGIQAKGKELGLEWDAIGGETFLQFRDRVKAEAKSLKVVPMVSVG